MKGDVSDSNPCNPAIVTAFVTAPDQIAGVVSGRGLELEENYNSTGICDVQTLDSTHLSVRELSAGRT